MGIIDNLIFCNLFLAQKHQHLIVICLKFATHEEISRSSHIHLNGAILRTTET